ncbi:MAG: hypothetical protein IT440_11455 [Phycisphaeraceae bacterium]|nr:hypothetical protein [Phycisphaeraceae bacterium]
MAYRKGHRYATLVYQLDQGCRRLLYGVEGRANACGLVSLALAGNG